MGWTQEMLQHSNIDEKNALKREMSLIEEEESIVRKLLLKLEDHCEKMSYDDLKALMDDAKKTLGEGHWATQAIVIACIRDMMHEKQANRPLNNEAMLYLCERLLRWFSVNSKNSVFPARTAALVQTFHELLQMPTQLSDVHLDTLNALTLMTDGVTMPELMERSIPDFRMDSDLD